MAVATVACLSAILVSCGRTQESGDQDAAAGFRLLLDDRYEEAAERFERAVRKGLSEQKYEEVYTCLGNAYNELSRWQESIDCHKKAIEANPRFHKAWVNLGIVYRLTGDFAEAEKCYRKALELEPDYAELHASIGALYIFQERYDDAVKHLEKAIELDRQLPVAWANLSVAYATVGRFENAESALKRAILLGYKNGPILRERIDNLKALASSPSQGAATREAGDGS